MARNKTVKLCEVCNASEADRIAADYKSVCNSCENEINLDQPITRRELNAAVDDLLERLKNQDIYI